MTCIVGYEEDGKVYMGCDSLLSYEYNCVTIENKKVFQNGPMILGFAGCLRSLQVLQYSFKTPKQQKRDDFQYLCTDFTDSLIKCFKENIKEDNESEFLLGYKSKLYRIESNFQIIKNITPYNACGSGEFYAMGVMYALHKNKRLSPENKIIKALSAAESFSLHVRRPFHVVSL